MSRLEQAGALLLVAGAALGGYSFSRGGGEDRAQPSPAVVSSDHPGLKSSLPSPITTASPTPIATRPEVPQVVHATHPFKARSELSPAVTASVQSALVALRKAQREDGSWDGSEFPVAVTSMALLALLAGEQDPFEDPALERGVAWLLARVGEDGRFPKEGHTWVHVQGFATLCLVEVLRRAEQPLPAEAPAKHPSAALPCDVAALRSTVANAVRAIEAAQSSAGGWYYDRTATEHEHEGSTTVCAVQALVAAKRAGVPTTAAVLERGFEYLKATQNPDGTFQYRLGDGSRMNEGTAAGVATLALMEKLDFPVLIAGAGHLVRQGAEAIGQGHFPEYGQVYALLGMRVVARDLGDAVKGAREYAEKVESNLIALQNPDGTWPNRGWMAGRPHAYATALAALGLAVPAERLSIFGRGW